MIQNIAQQLALKGDHIKRLTALLVAFPDLKGQTFRELNETLFEFSILRQRYADLLNGKVNPEPAPSEEEFVPTPAMEFQRYRVQQGLLVPSKEDANGTVAAEARATFPDRERNAVRS